MTKLLLQNGLTALSIANKLGYITVEETLKVVTETTITTTTVTTIEEKYKVVAPDTMQETFMSDSEDDGGTCLLPKYINFRCFLNIKCLLTLGLILMGRLQCIKTMCYVVNLAKK